MRENLFIDFTDKVVMITGASSGIGRAVAVELSKNGAFVVLSGRDDVRLKETSHLLPENKFYILPLDLVKHEAILPAIQKLSAEVGKIYGLCHAAGVVQTRPLNSTKVESIKMLLDVNYIAGLELARAITRRDISDEQCGSILFISSIYAHIGMPAEVGYSGSKGAIVAAARSMAVELARRNIRVNTISPGYVKTPMIESSKRLLSQDQVKELEDSHPLGTGTPEDVAKACAFLLAPQSKWITGIDLIIDGGRTIS